MDQSTLPEAIIAFQEEYRLYGNDVNEMRRHGPSKRLAAALANETELHPTTISLMLQFYDKHSDDEDVDYGNTEDDEEDGGAPTSSATFFTPARAGGDDAVSQQSTRKRRATQPKKKKEEEEEEEEEQKTNSAIPVGDLPAISNLPLDVLMVILRVSEPHPGKGASQIATVSREWEAIVRQRLKHTSIPSETFGGPMGHMVSGIHIAVVEMMRRIAIDGRRVRFPREDQSKFWSPKFEKHQTTFSEAEEFKQHVFAAQEASVWLALPHEDNYVYPDMVVMIDETRSPQSNAITSDTGTGGHFYRLHQHLVKEFRKLVKQAGYPQYALTVTEWPYIDWGDGTYTTKASPQQWSAEPQVHRLRANLAFDATNPMLGTYYIATLLDLPLVMKPDYQVVTTANFNVFLPVNTPIPEDLFVHIPPEDADNAEKVRIYYNERRMLPAVVHAVNVVEAWVTNITNDAMAPYKEQIRTILESSMSIYVSYARSPVAMNMYLRKSAKYTGIDRLYKVYQYHHKMTNTKLKIWRARLDFDEVELSPNEPVIVDIHVILNMAEFHKQIDKLGEDSAFDPYAYFVGVAKRLAVLPPW